MSELFPKSVEVLKDRAEEILKDHAENQRIIQIIDDEIKAVDDTLADIKSPRLGDVAVQSGISDPTGAIAYLLDVKGKLLQRRCMLLYKVRRVERALRRIETDESTILEASFICPSKKQGLNYSSAQFYRKRNDALDHFAKVYGCS